MLINKIAIPVAIFHTSCTFRLKLVESYVTPQLHEPMSHAFKMFATIFRRTKDGSTG